MGIHRKSDHNARKAKYDRQKVRTAANKERNKRKMMAANPCYPKKKGEC